MKVSGLLFEMEDVLYDASMWRRWLYQLLLRMGLHTHYHAFFRVWQREFLDDVNRGEGDYWEAMRAFLTSAGLARGQIDEVVAAGHARRRQLQESIRPFPGVLPAVNRLNSVGVRLCILSNTWRTTDQIQELLVRLGLSGRFDDVLSSAELGCTKPSRESYQAAMNCMRLKPGDVAFVGNDSDQLAGAASAGMPTIAVNYSPDAKADVFLDRLDQVFAHLQSGTPQLLAG